MKAPLRFGTDGWRGVFAEDFTFANLEVVTQAVADTLEKVYGPGRSVVVGYDTRFRSEGFALRAAEVLAGNGFTVFLSSRAVPTPVVSYAVTALGAAAGVVVTASHNPYQFNGLKVKAHYGGSVTPEFTQAVEEVLGRRPPMRLSAAEGGGRISERDIFEPYRVHLAGSLLPLIRPLRPHALVFDPMHGACAGLLEPLLPEGWGEVHTIHSTRDPMFGGLHPEPIPPHLDPLAREVLRRGADLGIATDGDGDRVGAVSPHGTYVSPHQVFALLIQHLVRNRGLRGEVAKSFAMGVQGDRVAQALGLPLHVTPVGFKHLCHLMLTRDILIAGEESGGIGIKGHIPERDGLLTGLLLLEMMTVEGKGLDELVRRLEAEVGRFFYRRTDYPLPASIGRVVIERLRSAPPDRFAGLRVCGVDHTDGPKLLLEDGGWILFRASGTEPLFRVYAEASRQEALDALHGEAKALLDDLNRLKKD